MTEQPIQPEEPIATQTNPLNPMMASVGQRGGDRSFLDQCEADINPRKKPILPGIDTNMMKVLAWTAIASAGMIGGIKIAADHGAEEAGREARTRFERLVPEEVNLDDRLLSVECLVGRIGQRCQGVSPAATASFEEEHCDRDELRGLDLPENSKEQNLMNLSGAAKVASKPLGFEPTFVCHESGSEATLDIDVRKLPEGK